MTLPERIRHRPNELKFAIRDFLTQLNRPANVAEIRDGIQSEVGERPASSYRSSLQDETIFERVSRGVYRVK